MDGLEPLRPERPAAPAGAEHPMRPALPEPPPKPVVGESSMSGNLNPAPAASARNWSERPLVITGSQGPMVGILAEPAGGCRTAVLIVAGQPQTRVGAHRMFTDLARGLAARGVASLRFDVGGWGDSPGAAQAFERSDRDIAIAAAALRAACPPSTRLWLWGLCDGASAAVLALPALKDAGIAPHALCLVNPWVRSEASLADAMVKTYYLKRLMQGEFWGRLLTGKVPMDNLVREPLRFLKARFGAAGPARPSNDKPGSTAARPSGGDPGPSGRGPKSGSEPSAVLDAVPEAESRSGHEPQADLPSQLIACLTAYRGEVYTVLSGNDLTAAETDALMARDKRWRKRLDRKGALLRIPGADHTFSSPEHWTAATQWVAAQALR